ncbi:hypothetical protein ACHZ97_04115 [Lysobacter soli]|uniref:hypothetical protein n=1 Tax=Lysobacter soli TaxID=453783 RepID=UPI0037CAD803
MSDVHLSRQRRILDWLAANPKGATLPVIHQAVEPDIKSALFGASLGNLITKRKVQRTGAKRKFVYRLADVVPVDRRRREALSPAAKAALAPTKPMPVAKPVVTRAKPSPPRKAIATPPASIPTSAALSLSTLPSAPMRSHVVDAKQADRDAIARDVAAFLKRGGKIQKLRHGEHSQSGKSLAQQQSEFLATRSRVSEIPRHRRAKSAA